MNEGIPVDLTFAEQLNNAAPGVEPQDKWHEQRS